MGFFKGGGAHTHIHTNNLVFHLKILLLYLLYFQYVL